MLGIFEYKQFFLKHLSALFRCGFRSQVNGKVMFYIDTLYGCEFKTLVLKVSVCMAGRSPLQYFYAVLPLDGTTSIGVTGGGG